MLAKALKFTFFWLFYFKENDDEHFFWQCFTCLGFVALFLFLFSETLQYDQVLIQNPFRGYDAVFMDLTASNK